MDERSRGSDESVVHTFRWSVARVQHLLALRHGGCTLLVEWTEAALMKLRDY